MDRRTVLAIVLMAGVMLIYQTFLAPVSVPPVEPAERTDSSSAQEPVDNTSPGRGVLDNQTGGEENQAEGLQPPSDTDGSRIAEVEMASISASPRFSVTKSNYRATLDPGGLRIPAWQISSYTDRDDAVVDLASQPGGLIEMALLTDAGRINISGLSFESTQVSEDVVRFSTTTASGLGLEFRYEFKDDFLTEVELQTTGAVPGRRNAELEISFPAPLPDVEMLPSLNEKAAASLVMIDGKTHKETVHKKKTDWSKHREGIVQWVGVRSRYFLAAAIPAEPVAGTYDADVPRNVGEVRTRLRIPLTEDPSEPVSFALYAGPISYDVLAAHGKGLESAVELGWKVIRPFSRLLMKCMAFLHQFIPNYGVVIIIVSVIAKLAFFPLTKKSMQSMKGLQDLKPEMEKVNEQYKDDPQAKQKAIFALYKEHKVNPVGGCLPMLVQMPVFVALYNVLANSIELRKEPFFLWINDLSIPDSIATIFGMPIHVLPILMGVTMLIQQRLTPSDPRQAALMYIMPVMMLFFFYNLPSGLVLYWTISNVLQIVQQAMTNRENGRQLATT